jgi:hypothetical protein
MKVALVSWIMDKSFIPLTLRTSSTIAALFSAQPFNSFSDDDWNHYQCRNWIGPPQPKHCIEHQTAEQDGRQIGTELGLLSVGVHRGTSEIRSNSPFCT